MALGSVGRLFGAGAKVVKGVAKNKAVIAGGAGTAAVISGINVSERFSGGPPGTQETIDRQSTAPKVFKFPPDDITAGNFWTRLIIYSWVPIKREELVPKQNHGLDRSLMANIWLPMPLTLGTAYNQNYTEVEDMMVNRGAGFTSDADGGIGALIEKATDQIGATGWGLAKEGANLVSGAVAINASGKMNLGSIMNQNMGLVYDGASLRSHSFSWRMTPRDRDEQMKIESIIFALKGYASPAVKGATGQDVNFSTSKKAEQAITDKAESPHAHGTASGGAGDSLRSIGRLAIPPTVSVEFWYGAKRNPHLFQVKDSFIQSVEVNYTPTGTWNAYEDGAPVETQLTLNLKENAIITKDDIISGGY